MNDLVITQVKKLINEKSLSILQNPEQFHDLLLKLLPENNREVDLLTSAIECRGLISKLQSCSSHIPKELGLGQLYSQLQKDIYITPEAAEWVVKTLAVCLDIISPEEWVPNASEFRPQFSQDTPKILKHIIKKYDNLVDGDWKKLRAYISDYSQNTKENKLLLKAPKIGIADNLLKSKNSLSKASFLEFSQELQKDFFLLPDAANWCIETWILALDINHTIGGKKQEKRNIVNGENQGVIKKKLTVDGSQNKLYLIASRVFIMLIVFASGFIIGTFTIQQTSDKQLFLIKQKLSKITEEKNTTQEKLSQLQNERDNIQERLSKLQAKNDEIVADSSQIIEEKNNTKQKLSQLQNERDNIQQQLSNLENQNNNMRQKLSNLENENKRLKSQLNSNGNPTGEGRPNQTSPGPI